MSVQTRLDTLPTLSTKVTGTKITKAARLADVGVVTYNDLLTLPNDKFRSLNAQLIGIDLTALRKKVRDLVDPPKLNESQPTINDLRRLPKRGPRKNYAEPADFPERENKEVSSSSSEEEDDDSEEEPLTSNKKRKGAAAAASTKNKRKVTTSNSDNKKKHKKQEQATDTLVVVKRKEPPFPSPNWRNVASSEAVRMDSLRNKREQIVDKELIKIEDHTVLEGMLSPLLPHFPKDCARIVAEYCLEDGSFRTIEVMVDFARLQHLVSWGHSIAPCDREAIFSLFHQARKRLLKKQQENELVISDKEKTKNGFDFSRFDVPSSHPIGSIIFQQTPIPAVNTNHRVHTTLYNYQLASLSWMIHLEQIVDYGKKWPVHIELDEETLATEKNSILRRKINPTKIDCTDQKYKWPGQSTSLCFDETHGRIYPPEDSLPTRVLSWVTAVRIKLFAAKIRARAQKRLQRDRSVNHASTLGGVLADEMGLGKSLTCIALIASHQPKPKLIQSHCASPTACTYISRASLIVCPNHLVQQWEEQIKQHSSLKSICITTKLNHQKLTYADLLTTDVVVVSTHFMEGDYYHKLEMKALTNFPNPKRDVLVSAQSKFMLLQRSSNNPLDLYGPLLSHFTWHRLILDEGHEVCAVKSSNRYSEHKSFSRLFESVDRLDAKHRWYVSGTPFPSADDSAIGLLRFLRVGIDGVEPGQCERPYVLGLLKQAWFCRNTKKSIGNEHCVPGIYEQTEWLELTPVERGLYWWGGHSGHHSNRERLRHLACYSPMSSQDSEVTSQGSLGHMHAAMVMKLRHLITSTQGQITRLRTELGKASKGNWEYKRLTDQLETQKEELQKCNQTLNYFKNIGILLGYPEVPLSPTSNTTSITTTSSSSSFSSSSSSSSSSSFSSSSSSSTTATTATTTTTTTTSTTPAIPPPPPPIVKLSPKELMRSSAFLALQHCGLCKALPPTIYVSSCGHVMCEECLDANLAIAHKCPSCSAPMERNEMAAITLKQKATAEQEVIERNGTKLGTVVNKILQLIKVPHHRIIVFSQYDELLLKFAAICSENSIGNYFVRGNVHVRNKAIKEFQEAVKPTVLLLSLSNAASGTDLAVATHVLLLDPLGGTEDEAKATEAQAIGRAFRQGQKNRLLVIRFVVKNTIEQELHDRKTVDKHESRHRGFGTDPGYGHMANSKFPF